MDIDNLSIDELAALAAQTEDQSVDTGGGDYERVLPPAGPTAARFIEYIEFGVHPQKPYQGKAKPDVEQVRLTFELNSPKYIREIDVDGGKKKIPHIITLTLTKKLGEKAAYKKLFNKMVYGREGKVHMAQMLGEGFIITIVHNTVGEGNDKKTYANMSSDDGTWLISAPVIVDPISQETKKVPVPEAMSPKRIFLFNNPNHPTWDSLFIDGTRTVKVDGKDVEQSKNWMQEKIKSAKNYPGSPLDLMLNAIDLPDTAQSIAKEEKAEPAKVVTAETQDPMAALGLS